MQYVCFLILLRCNSVNTTVLILVQLSKYDFSLLQQLVKTLSSNESWFRFPYPKKIVLRGRYTTPDAGVAQSVFVVNSHLKLRLFSPSNEFWQFFPGPMGCFQKVGVPLVEWWCPLSDRGLVTSLFDAFSVAAASTTHSGQTRRGRGRPDNLTGDMKPTAGVRKRLDNHKTLLAKIVLGGFKYEPRHLGRTNQMPGILSQWYAETGKKSWTVFWNGVFV